MRRVRNTEMGRFSAIGAFLSHRLGLLLIAGLLLGQSGSLLAPGAAYADVLSGANGATLVRAPQQTPDALGTSRLNGLQYADPAAQLDLVQPPVANNQGDAQLSYPLSVPPGRGGLNPDLALSYSSSGGNGWLGLGWDLSTGAVSIDTRWGVPRYDGAKESETYILDGDVLAPTAVRTVLLDRANERVFTRRVEGLYEQIIRHGSAPGAYWWEIKDKSGTRRFYGGTLEHGRDNASVLTDGNGREFRWGLKQVVDISNNTMTFNYVTVNGTGVGAFNSAVGHEMYLSSIAYNGVVGSNETPAYEVRFVRASQLGEPTRQDVTIDGRGGFLRVTADLLRRVDVLYRGALAKRYVLNYSQRAFGKSLLANVTQAGSDGAEFARHTFDYFNDVGYNGSTYQGFAPNNIWSTGGDGIGNGIDLGSFGSGNASALGGVHGLGTDGHVYLGFNIYDGSKEGSFGGSIAMKLEDDTSLLEMIDINGDNLPDKVFQDGSGLSYRLNSSGPAGGTAFGPKRPILGIGRLSNETRFGFGFGPEAYFGVQLLYNHAWTWAWGRTYFLDVNQDGLVDLVDNGMVFFNRPDINGNPTFSPDSSTTAVPIDTGMVDPSVLPVLTAIEAQIRAQAPLQDTLRRWEAPWTGRIRVEGDVQLLPPASGKPAGDGVRVAIQHGGSELWSALIDGTDHAPATPTGVADISVNRGDFLYFRVGSRDDGASDTIAWDPRITYLNVASTQDANGLDVYRYQGSSDFTLAGLNDMFVMAPLDGQVHVAGDFVKAHKTSDDIRLEVRQNGTAVGAPIVIAGDATGTFPLSRDLAVASKDRIELRAKIDSPVDLAAFSWNPRLYYTSATRNGQPVTVTDANGKPTLDLQAPADIQVYPRTDLAAPQQTWVAPLSAAVTAVADVTFKPTDQDGMVVLTVKKKIAPAAEGDAPSELIAKQTLTIQNGQVVGADPASLTFNPENGAEYWFDLSVAQAGLGSNWISGSVALSSSGSTPATAPSARHWTYVPEQVFPPSYRGWAYAGYNAADGRADQPVDESRLALDVSDFPQAAPQLTTNTDYPTVNDVDPNYKNPINGKAYMFAPQTVVDANGAIVGRIWRGGKDNLFGSAAQAGSSRLGPDSVSLPTAGQLVGANGVTRYSMSQQDAFVAGLGGLVGGSSAWGNSKGYIDFLDMNGDGFPDVVGSGGVQYTGPRGALQWPAIPSPLLGDSIRSDRSTAKTFDAGGTVAEIAANSKGKSNQAQETGSNSSRKPGSSSKGNAGHGEKGDKSQAGVSLGLAGGLGWSSTGTPDDAPSDDVLQTDLTDMNGDGLPDRVTAHKSGLLTVAFNLGYSFAYPEVVWPGGTFQQGRSESQSIGASAGFSSGDMAFAGGVSLAGADNNTPAMWVDLNGDGLPDQLLAGGGPVLARFNTGAGLTNFVNWGAFKGNQIATSKNVSLGGGFDFTIGIGPVCEVVCYIIINPGGHTAGSISRPELQLVDVNGDGYADHVNSDADWYMGVSLNTTGRTNLLKSIANPLGGTITLDYTRKGNTTSEAFSQWVMSSVAVNDGRSGDGPDVQLTTYDYGNNVYNALERSFLGYDTVMERQHNTALAGSPVVRSYVRAYRNATVFDSGLLASETLTDAAGVPLKATVNDYNLVDATTGAPVDLHPDPAGVGLLQRAVFPRLVKTENDFYNAGTLAKRTWNTFAYDTLGNVTETVDVGEPDLPGDDVIATTTYSDCRTSSWVGLPQMFIVKDAGGTILRHRWADDLLCQNGAVTTLYEDTGSGVAQTNLAFDQWGNYNQIIYPPNAAGQRYEVDYVYDDDRHTDIARIDDSFGLVGMATFDSLTGQVASRTDANGQRTSYTYDVQGRLATVTGPYEQGSGHATIRYEYFPTAPAYAYAVAHHFDAIHPDDTIDTVRFLDGVGRETQTKQDATLFRGAALAAQNVMVVAGAVEFDALGRPVKQWYPIEEALGTIGTYNTGVDSVAPTQTMYDLADRVINETTPDGSVTGTSYGFGGGSLFGTSEFLATRTDALGNVRRSYSDVRDNVLAQEADHRTGSTVQTLRTTYVYNPLQQLHQVLDPGGNLTSHEYDLLGRRTATTTPDGGRVAFAYDLASNQIARETPNLRAAGGRISYAFDFNRLTGISYSDGTPSVSYQYGAVGAAANGAGRIVKVTDGARVQTRAYGRLGEITAETTTMLVHNLVDSTEARLTWTTASDFDSLGRARTVTYPDGEVVSYGYDSGGLLSSMAGNKAGVAYPLIVRQEYDKFLARRYQLDGNNVGQELRYNTATNRLERMIANAPGRAVQDLTYTYDRVGNVLTANNAAPVPVTSLLGGTSAQTFAYDDLYQLTSATGVYTFAPGKHRDYTYNLVYDNLGNIVRKSQTDTIFSNPKGTPQAPTTYTQLYTYGAAAHQPIRIGGKTYTYDADGNLAGWTDDTSGQNRTVTWDAEDRVTSVADQGSTTRYTYDDQGQLAIQRGPQGETSFVNRYYTVLNGSVAWKNYWAGDERIATRREMPDGQPEQIEYFFHKNLQGSTNFITDINGAVFEFLEYFPSGEQWVFEHNDIYRTPYLYTGAYFDEFRTLYNFSARWYAPQEQIMYSPDPLLVQEPAATISDPALLPAYTYVENNPLRLVDLSGRFPVDAARLLKNNWSTVVRGVFKPFATFKAEPLLRIKLEDTGNGMKFKNIKVAPFFFKQFKIVKARPPRN